MLGKNLIPGRLLLVTRYSYSNYEQVQLNTKKATTTTLTATTSTITLNDNLLLTFTNWVLGY